jgi:GNAT superfamily N-acetyltransferase
MSTATIRLMTADDLDAAMALKDAEGWNQTREDWNLFLGMAPDSCLVAVEDDKVVGTVVGINYADRVAWIGMMLVNRSHRGRGISKMLMKDVIQSLNRVASIKLDATPAGFPVYRQLGFEEEYTLLRMVAYDPQSPSFSKGLVNRVGVLTEEELVQIYPLDKRVFGADRGQVVQHAFRSMPGLACRIKSEQGAKGYLFARQGTRYLHLGTIVAQTDAEAKALLAFALNGFTGGSLVIDVPKEKQAWVSWLESCGFQVQRELFRMFLKGNPYPGDPTRVFAVCGPELG